IRRMANTAVLPVPSPTTIPDWTSRTAASAACCLYSALESRVRDSGITERLASGMCLRRGHRPAGLAPIRRPSPLCDLREIFQVLPYVYTMLGEPALEQIDCF